jgi:hypothetical protein
MSQDDNFFYLTFSLILLLLGTALAQQFFSYSVQHLMQSATVITLIVAVWGVDSERLILRKALIFPLAIIAVALMSYWLDTTGFDYIHLFLLLFFFIFTAQQTAKQVLFTGEIDGNKILGAICLYLLMGLIWAILFTLMQLSFVRSFQGLGDSTEWFTIFPDFIYFSFVTLTTLGFGDIAPVQPVARFLVYLEAIIGQLYLAILVASLVGSRMSAVSNKGQ